MKTNKTHENSERTSLFQGKHIHQSQNMFAASLLFCRAAARPAVGSCLMAAFATVNVRLMAMLSDNFERGMRACERPTRGLAVLFSMKLPPPVRFNARRPDRESDIDDEKRVRRVRLGRGRACNASSMNGYLSISDMLRHSRPASLAAAVIENEQLCWRLYRM